mmetsp:Transcript_11538/g.25596  ORF Transcript_11538/g.25596 Transcript_11538/m.25596 type:complete len:212 (+) Transcript_11538:148-783(+)
MLVKVNSHCSPCCPTWAVHTRTRPPAISAASKPRASCCAANPGPSHQGYNHPCSGDAVASRARAQRRETCASEGLHSSTRAISQRRRRWGKRPLEPQADSRSNPLRHPPATLPSQSRPVFGCGESPRPRTAIPETQRRRAARPRGTTPGSSTLRQHRSRGEVAAVKESHCRWNSSSVVLTRDEASSHSSHHPPKRFQSAPGRDHPVQLAAS